MMIKSYQDLIVWQKSIKLVLLIYKLVKKYPKYEQYALANQMRRAVVTIPSNIAEGYARKHTKEYRQFLNVSFASCAELETQLIISYKLSYLTDNKYQESLSLLEEVSKMLRAIINKLTKP